MTSEGLAATIIQVDVPSSRYLCVKRIIDVVIAGLLLAILVLPFAVLALAIKLHSPGPVLFRQTRVGKDGKLFTFLKFRSMRHNADTSVHRDHVAALIKNHDLAPTEGKSAKIEMDPRVTGLGRILRKSSLDELPQLINVLRGEMSLIGPRPCIPYEAELFQEWHRRRFEVLPGITGWWQVKGRNLVSFDDAMRMDIYYIDHLSLWLDLKILIFTPFAVLIGKGAG